MYLLVKGKDDYTLSHCRPICVSGFPPLSLTDKMFVYLHLSASILSICPSTQPLSSWLQQPGGSRVSVGAWSRCECPGQRRTYTFTQCCFIRGKTHTHTHTHTHTAHWQLEATTSIYVIIQKLFQDLGFGPSNTPKSTFFF